MTISIQAKLGAMVVNQSLDRGASAVAFPQSGTALIAETGPAGELNASTITSSHAITPNGTPSPIAMDVPTLAAATGWDVATPDGRSVYTSNAGSGTISRYAISSTRELAQLSGSVVARNLSSSTNLDIAVSEDSKFLHAFDSGSAMISTFGIDQDGSLSKLGQAGGLSGNAGMNGIAAFQW